ncbi:hypothetical protein AB0B85_00495 [Micromonospora sp. NPDC049044]|uniref:hypothetical protein n=1 Tax=unclassified Micromonospora TaxID=2617518 RepID=UPI0033CA63F2
MGPAQQHGIKRAEEGRPKGADTSEPEAPKKTNPWDGDGLGNGNHKPSSTLAGKKLFPSGTTKTNPPA